MNLFSVKEIYYYCDVLIRYKESFQVCVERCPSSNASPWVESRLPLPLPGLKATLFNRISAILPFRKICESFAAKI